MLSIRKACFFIVLFTVWEACCFPGDMCKKLAKKKRGMCEKIYVWDKERQYFVSLINEVSKSFDEEEYESIKYKTIKVLVNNMMPYAFYSTSSGHLVGYLGDIWNVLAEKLEFSYEITSVSFDAGLELMSSGDADVMLGAVVYKKDLINVYYSHPYFYNWYHLYLKSPKGKPSSSLYAGIFYSKLSLVSFLLFCLLTTSVWITSRFLNSSYKIERRLSVPTCFLGIVSGYINQGFDLKLRSYSGRLQVMAALLFGLMLYYAMNAVLVAKIAVFDAPYPFASLQDIATKKTLSLCLRTSSFVYNNFTDEKRRILPDWRGILNDERCLDINDPKNIVEIICKDNVIILENKVVMSSLSKVAKFSCTIDAHGEKYFQSGNSFLMSRALREKRIIDKYVALIRSTGVMQRLEIKWIEYDKKVVPKASTSQVTIEHTASVFIFYIIAIFASLVVLGLEILQDKYANANGRVAIFYK